MQRSSLSIFSVGCLTLLTALAAGCGGGDRTSVPTKPNPGTIAVQSVQPANGATCVDQATAIQVTFNGSVNASSINTTNIALADSAKNPIAGTVALNSATNTATFTPSASLSSGAAFTLTVSAVTGAAGATMSQPFTSTFTTGPCGSAQTQYKVSLSNFTSVVGQVTVDTSGQVSVQISNLTPNTTFNFQFCPAPAQNYSCFAIADLKTDGSGSASSTAAFPKSGDWAGDFEITLAGTVQARTDIAPNNSSSVYSAILLPASTANGNGIVLNGPSPGPQDPLSSGTVTLVSGALQFVVKGAMPNSVYTATECPTFFGSSCYALYDSGMNGNFSTDASGNMTFTVSWDQTSGDIFEVDPSAARTGFVAGFRVP